MSRYTPALIALLLTGSAAYKTVMSDGPYVRLTDPCDPVQTDPAWTKLLVADGIWGTEDGKNVDCDNPNRACITNSIKRPIQTDASILGKPCKKMDYDKPEPSLSPGTCTMKTVKSASNVSYAFPHCELEEECKDYMAGPCSAFLKNPLSDMAGFTCNTKIEEVYNDLPADALEEAGDIDVNMLRGRYSDYCPVTCEVCDSKDRGTIDLAGIAGVMAAKDVAISFTKELCVLMGYVEPVTMGPGKYEGEIWAQAAATCPLLATATGRRLSSGRFLATTAVSIQIEAVTTVMRTMETKMVAEDTVGVPNNPFIWPDGTEALGLSMVGNPNVTASITVDREGEEMGLGFLASLVIIVIVVLLVLCTPIYCCCCRKKKKVGASS